ncbi:hypothetical protein F5B20DRAFT_583402 [Whalleya microplaca]|nr:hypothetical protein F5B20DRAFT_583402 [Whalleya microplaca]
MIRGKSQYRQMSAGSSSNQIGSMLARPLEQTRTSGVVTSKLTWARSEGQNEPYESEQRFDLSKYESSDEQDYLSPENTQFDHNSSIYPSTYRDDANEEDHGRGKGERHANYPKLVPNGVSPSHQVDLGSKIGNGDIHPVPETRHTQPLSNGPESGSRRRDSSAIAIIGMSCRLPGDATNPEKLWELCAQGREAWSEWPSSRFNQNAFYHPNPERGGTFNAKGGHFLNQGMGEFDATFFNITPTEAKALDPQQRIQLENAYEALENAGIPLDKIAGSNTGVYIGTSNHDYEHMFWKDPDSLPLYHAVGLSASIMANRISHFFDLRGPSVTVDTACSSTLVALHQACQSIRTGETTQAIVGGTNLILEPGMLIPMSSLKFFSPEGTCYTYDHRASGYGRGEGTGTVVLKALDDAIRDGDTIRCVIRSTGVNADGRTAGLMLPNGDAQESLIRSTYATAGLDPAFTRYIESHGTGTKAGDPIESSVLGRVFGAASASIGAPNVRVGSVKTNIGHLENASGIASLIKAILSVEKGMILPNSNFEQPGDRVVLAENHLEVPKKLELWPDEGLRRASVCAFGFGGTNAHCVLDDAVSYLESNRIASCASRTTPNRNVPIKISNGIKDKEYISTPRIFAISANDEHTMAALSKVYATHIGERVKEGPPYAERLAYTLHSRRSILPWRVAVVASSLHELSDKLASDNLSPSRASVQPRVGFVFTGQGAQWHGMGRELMDTYPAFKISIEASDRHLKLLGSSWSLIEELYTGEDLGRIGIADISQPACTAVQIAIVDLLLSWKVKPAAVVGHSSGEISAAYAAGALTLESSIAIAYYRGLAMKTLKQVAPDLRGGMLAAGISAAEAQKLIAETGSCELTIACINSPSSVTISGDEEALGKIERLLENRKLFARRLKVEVAYHSHHMLYASNGYLENLLNGTLLPDGANPNHSIIFASSLNAGPTNLSDLTATYWVRNMVSPVQFSEALSAMVSMKQSTSIDTLLEIGPHSTLAGPIKQTLASLDLKTDIRYIPTLVRNQHACTSLLDTACGLWMQAYPIDINEANRLQSPELKYRPLTDLPPYPFNHTVNHWHESRLSRDYRFRKEGRHDLLGALVPDSNTIEPRWRNLLRLQDVPWIKDHVVQSTVIFPAAGYIAMAIEAARQEYTMSDRSTGSPKKVRLRNICLSSGLVVPESENGIETSLSLRPVPDGDRESSAIWSEFRIFSYTEAQEWTEHCRGQVAFGFEVDGDGSHNAHELIQDEAYWKQVVSSNFRDCHTSLPTEDLHNVFENMGLAFGPAFCNLDSVWVGPRNSSVSEISIPDTKATMPHQAEFFNIIHPCVLDSCFQAAFPSLIHDGKLKDPMVPTFIESLTVDTNLSRHVGARFKAYALARPFILRSCLSDITVFNTEPSSAFSPAIQVTGLKTTSLTWGSARSGDIDISRRICYRMPWEPDVDLLDGAQINSLWSNPDPGRRVDAAESLAVLEWLAFQFIKEGLMHISKDDYENMTWHHQRFYKWCQSQSTPAIAIEPCNTSLPAVYSVLGQEDSPTKMDAAVSIAKTLGAEGEVVLRIGQNFAPIMKGEVDPLALMVQDGLLTEVYTQDRSMLRCYELLHTYASRISFKQPDLVVLEIGAGTGGATQPLLEALGGVDGIYPRFSKYTYTDISSAFFEKARCRFAAWNDMIEYRTLDIERDVADQGFEDQSYDLIIAANVLHATRDMNVTMSNVRRLLKPGGRLIMIEITHPRLRIFLPFGTLPGWWLGEGDGREMGPLLNPTQWEDVLSRNGFDGTEVCEADYPGLYEMSSLIVSRAVSDKNNLSLNVQVFSPQGVSPGVSMLVKLLERDGHSPNIITLSELGKITNSPLVIMDTQEDGLLSYSSESKLSTIQETLNRARDILWVTSGASHGRPNSAMVSGLVRTLRNEDTALKLTTLDLDSRTAKDNSKAAELILRVLNSKLNGVGNFNDMEFIEQDGCIKIPRLVEYNELNELLARDLADTKHPPKLEPLHQPTRLLRLEVGRPGMLDSLQFTDVPNWEDGLDDDSLEIEVKAVGLNFRDILTVLGQIENPYPLGFDSSGVVTAVGRNVTGFNIGDKVAVGLAVGCFTSVHRVKAHHVVHLPSTLSFEDGASISLPFATAYYALVDVARISKGQKILIHSAAGGVGQAAVKLAQLAKAEVFVTVGSDEKRQLMLDEYGIPASHIFSSRNTGFAEKVMRMTAGKGVDIVLNSLAGELFKETWNCIAMFGFFLEIGKRDIYANMRLEMRPFDKHVTFSAIDLSAIFANRPQWGAQILNDCFKLFHEGKLSVMKPITTFSIDQAETAFRFMQSGKHMGKIVVTIPENVQVMVAPKADVKFLRHDATYVIAGGAGGLGREICKWMVDNGARNILLLSRSGISGNQKAQALVNECAAKGAVVKVSKCDTRYADQLTDVLHRAEREDHMPPVRGVVNGAMILRDSLFENMSFADWKAVTDTKLQSTWNLHNQFLDTDNPLDFFILLSSASGVSGNRGQSNYAASSTFQDAFAHYRRSLGLSATTLDLGMIESAGYVADNADSVAYLLAHGYSMIKLKELFTMLRHAILTSKSTSADSCQIITGYDATAAEQILASRSKGNASGSGSTVGLADPKFSHLPGIHLSHAQHDRGAGDGEKTQTVSLQQALISEGPGVRRSEILTQAVVARLASLLGREAADVDEGRSVAMLGVDSLVAVELRNWIVGETGFSLPIFEILGAKSLVELAAKIEAGCSFLKDGDGDGDEQKAG